MRYVPADKYNVAWFKLAECVSRGEKERALGVYRLLSHSFDDPGFASQLEGDILFAFNDHDSAIDRYKQAAQHYKKTNRLMECAALYEHLVVLLPEKYECMAELVDIYQLLHMPAKTAHYVQSICAVSLTIDGLSQLMNAMDYLEANDDQHYVAQARHAFIVAWLTNEGFPSLIMHHVLKHVDTLAQSADQRALQQFLGILEGLNEECYALARAHVDAYTHIVV